MPAHFKPRSEDSRHARDRQLKNRRCHCAENAPDKPGCHRRTPVAGAREMTQQSQQQQGCLLTRVRPQRTRRRRCAVRGRADRGRRRSQAQLSPGLPGRRRVTPAFAQEPQNSGAEIRRRSGSTLRAGGEDARTNRVTPMGDIVAIPLRGAWTGNRGKKKEKSNPKKAGGREIAASHAGDLWITCALEFRGRWREQWLPHRWTHLFFYDEAISLAAGHRPCAECRRGAYRAYQAAWASGLGGALPAAARINRQLHAERSCPAPIAAACTPRILAGAARRRVRPTGPAGPACPWCWGTRSSPGRSPGGLRPAAAPAAPRRGMPHHAAVLGRRAPRRLSHPD